MEDSYSSDGIEMYAIEDEQLYMYYDLHEYTNHGIRADELSAWFLR